MLHDDKLIEVPSDRPENLTVKEPKSLPWFLKPQLTKECEHKQHFVKFTKDAIQVDNQFRPFPTTVAGLRTLLKEVNPGYHQSFHGEEKRLYESILTESQLSDIRETGQCSMGGGDILQKMGQVLLLKEKHGNRFRNYQLSNTSHMWNFEKVPDEWVPYSPIVLSAKLESAGLFLPNMASQGSIARANILAAAPDAYFPLWMMDRDQLIAFYDSVKGPSFRSFVLGDSPDTVSSDLVNCYLRILKDTPSPSPYFNTYVWDTDYHHEAAFAAVKIWINIDQLEITPVGCRVLALLFEEDTIFPAERRLTVYPWGNIEQVNVNMPMLWFLLERLKLRLGKDVGIIQGVWAIPNGGPVFAWREWTRKVMKALEEWPDLKFLYQMGPTGGHYRKGTKVGEFEYEYEFQAFANENPIALSHLFDMTRVLVLLGASQSRKVKGFAADGWVSEGGAPDSIGPVPIGAVTYGPFPVKNRALELYYQFDQLRHQEIVSMDEHEDGWRELAEEYADKPEMEYFVEVENNYGEVLSHKFKYAPSMGDVIPDREPELVGDTLGEELKGKPPHTTQAKSRAKQIREPGIGGKYGQVDE